MRQRAASPAAAGAIATTAKILVEGMRELGFETLLPDRLQAPIIVTFHMPADPNFVFEKFYDGLRDRGFVIYPGKLTVADSFRIGCIGRIGETEMKACAGRHWRGHGRAGRRQSAPPARRRRARKTSELERE